MANSFWVFGLSERTFEKETILWQSLFLHPNFLNVILPENLQSVDHYWTWGKSPQRCWHLKNLNFQQFLKLMSEIGKNDGRWCFTRILNLCSKTFKMLEFNLWIDLLLSHGQNSWFPKNAFSESDLEKMLHAVFMRPQNFGTKIKIHKKVLNFCWIARVLFWRKVFFSSRTC